MTAHEDNKAFVAAGIRDLLNNGAWDRASEYFAADVVLDTTLGGRIEGRDAVVDFLRTTRDAFPDGLVTPKHLVAEGDKVAVHWTRRGQNTGSIQGMPPSGAWIEVDEVAIYTLGDAGTTHIFHMVNADGMLRQLGVVKEGPPPAPVRAALALRRRFSGR